MEMREASDILRAVAAAQRHAPEMSAGSHWTVERVARGEKALKTYPVSVEDGNVFVEV